MDRKSLFLPLTPSEAGDLTKTPLDIVLVTGDAYVDHPSFGAAVIGRVLEDAGYRVGILAQPDWRSCRDFTRFGKPRLFFGVTSGNVDSMVSNLTPNRRRRRSDRYSPGGKAGLRPNRAVTVYSNRIREAFGSEVPIVLGGVEASLRRLAHYDFWDDAVRRSILLDCRADILVYGMGEGAVVQIARRLDEGEEAGALDFIPGTAVVRKEAAPFRGARLLPSYEEIKDDAEGLNRAFVVQERENRSSGRILLQEAGKRFVVQFPPPAPLTRAGLDAIYALPFSRAWHPSYNGVGGVPGLETVLFSITTSRGCLGNCSFCSLAAHQGKWVQSRSVSSILDEVERLNKDPRFRGIIADLGGPTANLYGLSCSFLKKGRSCGKRECLLPDPCPRLDLSARQLVKLLSEARQVKGVKRAFISSGIRHDLLLSRESDALLEEICRYHVSGRLKIAPEHSSSKVLRLMNKPPFSKTLRFAERFQRMNQKIKKKQFLVRYFMTAHPGCTLLDAVHLFERIRDEGSSPEQVQDFLPLPMTLSSCLYYTGVHPITGEKVFVEKNEKQRRIQRALLQFRNPQNARLVTEGLKQVKKRRKKRRDR